MALSLGFATLYLWRLGSLTKGLSSAEYLTKIQSDNLITIWHNPTNGPFLLAQHFVSGLPANKFLILRLVSSVLAVTIIICLYFLLKNWFGRLAAFFATIIFMSTPWVVLAGRSVAPDIAMLSPILLLAACSWLIRTKGKPISAWIVLCLAAGLSLYTPGLIWVVIAGLIIGWRQLAAAVAKVPRPSFIAGLVVFFLTLVPLIWAIAAERSVAESVAGLPQDWSSIFSKIGSIFWSGIALIWYARDSTDYSIGHSAVLTTLEVILLLFGIYALGTRVRRVSYALLLFIAIALVLAGLNNNPKFLLLALPSAILLIAAGLRYLYVEWRTIFPRNPIPKYLALFLMTLIVAAQFVYGAVYSIEAWPHTEQTKKIYVLK